MSGSVSSSVVLCGCVVKVSVVVIVVSVLLSVSDPPPDTLPIMASKTITIITQNHHFL